MNKDQTLTLPSGVEISFRVVRPDDAPALQRLHARCSEPTIYLRFFGSMKKLSDEQARYFYAPVKAGNKRMLNVLRHLDLPEQERVEDGGDRAILRRKLTHGVRASDLTLHYASGA
jgi:hypothetical protein